MQSKISARGSILVLFNLIFFELLRILTINLGQLALQHILDNGGSGSFRTRVVENYLWSGHLTKVGNYSKFTFPVYVVYKKQTQNEFFQKVLDSLFKAGESEEPWL